MSGLVMMLVTATLSPPSWAAMLPQKFSAAVTRIALAGPPPEGSVVRPHPAASRATSRSVMTAERLRRTGGGRCLGAGHVRDPNTE